MTEHFSVTPETLSITLFGRSFTFVVKSFRPGGNMPANRGKKCSLLILCNMQFLSCAFRESNYVKTYVSHSKHTHISWVRRVRVKVLYRKLHRNFIEPLRFQELNTTTKSKPKTSFIPAEYECGKTLEKLQ